MTKVAANKVAVADFDINMMDEKWIDTSKKIRGLASQGYTTSEIEKIFIKVGVTTKLGAPIRYQHIRNVLHTQIGKSE